MKQDDLRAFVDVTSFAFGIICKRKCCLSFSDQKSDRNPGGRSLFMHSANFLVFLTAASRMIDKTLRIKLG